MSMDKNLARIEAKLDALLEENGLKPEDYAAPVTTGARAPRELTAAEQQAIDNAPKTPVGAQGPTNPAATPPPATPTAPVPADAVGTVTVETQQPDGTTRTQTMPASEARQAQAQAAGEPFGGYAQLSAEQVIDRLGELDDAGRERVLAYERSRGSRGRKTIIDTLVNWNS